MSSYSFDSFYQGSLVLRRKTDRHVDKTVSGTKFFVNNSGWGRCFFLEFRKHLLNQLSEPDSDEDSPSVCHWLGANSTFDLMSRSV